tara:strand:+ start:175 stop:375 length:201 start_codon:yes stop_codon:yes gene_type:complete
MAFIPNTINRVRLIEDVEIMIGTFTSGHEFDVVSVENRGGTAVYHLKDDDGREIHDVTRESFENIG